jgi:magnesium chelatase family protein
LARLSGPLLDRVDLRVRLEAVTSAQLTHNDAAAESSSILLARVTAARAAAAGRWAAGRTNSQISGRVLRSRTYRLPADTTRRLTEEIDKGLLSARGFDRVLRMAWTISDLDGRDRPNAGDIAEAVYLRGGAH